MNGKDLSKLFKIDASHALYRDDGKWYHNLKKFPGVLFDKNGYIIFQDEATYFNHPDLQIKRDLHIKNGISSLKEYIKLSQLESGILISENRKSSPENIIRVRREIDQILRNQTLVTQLKSLYENKCQLCKEQLTIGNGKYYSEVHHIKPLGQPHFGPDNLYNMINVCPNHHALLDLRVMPLLMKDLKILRHDISLEYLDYHNSFIKTY